MAVNKEDAHKLLDQLNEKETEYAVRILSIVLKHPNQEKLMEEIEEYLDDLDLVERFGDRANASPDQFKTLSEGMTMKELLEEYRRNKK
ncbi:hypothetical protein [Desmospora profundinema]|uniref:Pantoate kinase n=1 Tax=Desmospora profundinema TaxID=1571184 RepID=A0ABU1IQI5_9BACL|nr:hypothetical protein [Desmospora profundinema]MDR6226184.1 pantoate kinase [Desmospora profundinema]